jgi:ATP adenylyltransferase
MERLWSPWRMNYVTGTKRPGCVFCNALAAGDDRESLILYRGQHCFIMLNLYPYNSGHTMVVPYAHAASVEDLDHDTRAEMFDLSALTVEASRRVLHCTGFNLGMNIGEMAGAGVADHLHEHVVPRWVGDANFMPILGDTMVMPELLPATYGRLRAEIEGILAVRERQAKSQGGALVLLPGEGKVVLRLSTYGGIGLPKGGVEQGESVAQAAVREVAEETGYIARVVGWAGSIFYQREPEDENSLLRHAAFMIATGEATSDVAAHLDSDTLLVPIDEAADTVTLPGLPEIVRNAVPILHRLDQQMT